MLTQSFKDATPTPEGSSKTARTGSGRTKGSWKAVPKPYRLRLHLLQRSFSTTLSLKKCAYTSAVSRPPTLSMAFIYKVPPSPNPLVDNAARNVRQIAGNVCKPGKVVSKPASRLPWLTTFSYQIRYPNIPCVRLRGRGGNKLALVPLELFYVIEGNRVPPLSLDVAQTAKMIDVTQKELQGRQASDLKLRADTIKHEEDDFLQASVLKYCFVPTNGNHPVAPTELPKLTAIMMLLAADVTHPPGSLGSTAAFVAAINGGNMPYGPKVCLQRNPGRGQYQESAERRPLDTSYVDGGNNEDTLATVAEG
ncbi:hypothetical protein CF327_g5922 [Tilletia walkeri]|uniref:Uncharacterized protein n=1 Tax=Tilletia walkeri TaxID=117179 RepID=A0A8X7T3J5_9BASI|nr:hypothetical protein CF327_g5922 [Tilletia walkeri]KAE8267461.1 hypothetical protein A4X09_0g4884 [Tilletia walkeri]